VAGGMLLLMRDVHYNKFMTEDQHYSLVSNYFTFDFLLSVTSLSWGRPMYPPYLCYTMFAQSAMASLFSYRLPILLL